jgi:hypothetical protein
MSSLLAFLTFFPLIQALLVCPVVFDIAPEARQRASLEDWMYFASRTVRLANRELRFHNSKILLAVYGVNSSSLGIYATPSLTLAAYAASRPAITCIHVLVSDRKFQSRIIGLAYVDGRCSATRSYAAVFDAFEDHARQTVFHELLHVLGAEHTESDATSVLAPLLSYNFALPDEPDWSPAVNLTAQGCETFYTTPWYILSLSLWDDNTSFARL